MANRMVVCSSYTGISEETRRCMATLMTAGWAAHTQTGCADVALARNLALTVVCQKLPDHASHVLLMIDDDVMFRMRDADEVCDLAEASQRPVSGVYSTARGTVAATRLLDDKDENLYLTGLGFLAIPARVLHELQRQSKRGLHMGEEMVVFTWSAPASTDESRTEMGTGAWLSEDYRLTMRLGGARIAQVGIGHLKRVPLYPDGESLARFGRGLPML